MLLISGSFYFYARLNAQIIDEQNQDTARLLVGSIILESHMTLDETPLEYVNAIQNMARSLKPNDYRDLRWRLMKTDLENAETSDLPTDEVGHEALQLIRSGKQSEVIRQIPDKLEYRYYAAVRAKDSCLDCHQQLNPKLQAGDLMGMVKVALPLTRTKDQLAENNAILLAMAIVTSFFAMLAAYAIVRYVIVKPVLHLRTVSEEIAEGNFNSRAEIHTGDELEELSHAFNRMLRHLVSVQEELELKNKTLDENNDELAQSNWQLYEMNRVKNEFLATMSHELRTPLNSILGFSDLLTTASNLNEKQQKFARNITSSGKRLLDLINDILDLAKIESGEMCARPLDLNLIPVIEELCQSVQSLATQKNIALDWDCDPSLTGLWQDHGKLQQVVINLLSNAIKFTPHGGRVKVVAEAVNAEQFQIKVEDTGIGIPLADQERIFEKFRQGSSFLESDGPLTREYEGTGLGLSIVKELCRLLGGEISLESEYGKGSIFTVVLPKRVPEDRVTPRKSEMDLATEQLRVQQFKRPETISETSEQTPEQNADSSASASPSNETPASG